MQRILVTGAKGMAGSHLVDFLSYFRKYEVMGIDLVHAPDFIPAETKARKNFKYLDVDINDHLELNDQVVKFQPDTIFHLAAEAFVPDSWKDVRLALKTNVIGTANVLEAARLLEKSPVVQIACTSEEYGLVLPQEIPIKKTNVFRPCSPYGVSKIAAEFLGEQYWRSYGIRTIMTRTFNHTGPRQRDLYVLSSFVKQAIAYGKGEIDCIEHGDLTPIRDFTDVRDIIQGYIKAVQFMEQAKVGGMTFQLGGGHVTSIKQLLHDVLEFVGCSTAVCRQHQDRMRPSDVPILVCCSQEFQAVTGWRPKISFPETLRDMRNFWLQA